MTRPLPARVWRKMYREDARRNQGGRCCYCGWGITRREATLDHVVPISDGGSDIDARNFVAACENCNRAKGRMSAGLFRAWLRSGDDRSAVVLAWSLERPEFRERYAMELMLARTLFRLNRRTRTACKRIAASVGRKPREAG